MWEVINVNVTEINTIVGIVGAVVGLVGIVVGIIGWKSLKKSIEIKNNVKVQKGGVLKQTVQNGASLPDVVKTVAQYTDYRLEPVKVAINTLEKAQNILNKNPRYSIPILWVGNQEEYEQMKKNGEIDDSVEYLII